MNIDISNPVLLDIVRVLTSDDDRELIITDSSNKVQKKKINNKKVLQVPMLIYRKNIYKPIENKIKDYMSSLEHYEGLGIENIEQFLCYELYRTQRAVGSIKDIGKVVEEYINNAQKINAMGFMTLSQYIEYIMTMSTDKKDVGALYSLQIEYNKNKEELTKHGIFSLQDYVKYNDILTKAIIYYEELKLDAYKDDFLSFELREFSWKKEYKKQKGTLKNVQKYIHKNYKEELSIESSLKGLDIEYVNCPAYYYENFSLHNISEYLDMQKKIRSLEDRYISLKNEGKINISKIEYLKQELNIIK